MATEARTRVDGREDEVTIDLLPFVIFAGLMALPGIFLIVLYIATGVFFLGRFLGRKLKRGSI